MSAVNEPSLARREVGRRLRKLRREAGMTQDDAVAEAELSVGHLRRIEGGSVAVRTGNVLTLCRAYGAPNDVTDALVALAKGTHGKGLWEDNSVVPGWFGLYLGLEHSARQIETWDLGLIGGLLQTADYARAVLSRDDDADAATVDHRVEVRLRRQEAVLARAEVTALLGAGALMMQVGPPDVMKGQVEHLRALAERPNVYVGVVPWEAGLWPSVPYTILSFEDPEDPDIAYVELMTGAIYNEKAGELVQYRQSFAWLREQSVPVKEYT